ncbi:prepilin-type N-terminal cleavage/methylation domain-containing protein [Campylobacter corcagiensis]|uniref:Type II secretion system protein n=1 Tax=Campylobacter corcagiensis TaxID=1448857 RepID=A0A7M1LFX3_9BACT|nr:type II secretion system protein [Campylobacter corcagiensis]QKF64625.1 putative type II secretion system protein [Campylobacter corcagiensis]QOQ87203.1 type II secretion system protein [Campylobacter corcagiensis]
MRALIDYKLKKAFTMIELILVIVIVGILATIASDIYLNIYKNYAITRVVDDLESRTEIALEQISSRLSDRIPESVIARDIIAGNNNDRLYNAHRIPVHADRSLALEWIGSSVETRNLSDTTLANTIGWSGYVDLGASGGNTIKTLGSNLNNTENILNTLVGNKNDLALIFSGLLSYNARESKNGFGYQDSSEAADMKSNKIMRVDIDSKDTFKVRTDSSFNLGQITDMYHLAHSAYAIVPEPSGTANGMQLYNLVLYYNYKPWAGEAYSDANTKSALLLENVTLFRFRGLDGAMEMKICITDPSENYNFFACKTKAVF